MSTIERERVQETAAPVTTKEVLHRAADLLEEFGWCQGVASRAETGEEIACYAMHVDARRRVSYCHNGAIQQAKLDLGLKPDHYTGFGTPEAARWNDERGRTKAEVVARLRAAADAA